MTDHQLFRLILGFAPLAVVLYVSNQLARRKREVNSRGEPTLRLWGSCFLALMVGTFFLWETVSHLDDPFYQRHPENTAVTLFFCVASFLFGAWSYCYTITLSTTALKCRYWPFSTLEYSLDRIKEVEPVAAGTKILLYDGKKITILPSLSGRPYFLERLSAALAQRHIVEHSHK